ncbi:RrF2 family transcriptional regulator [Candidatus Poribacteria bacterium]
MELSTRARYGARFMVDLALHYGDGPVPLKDIAQRQEVSEKYLWNLMGPLKTMGLIRSTRGSYGGFVLAKPPSDINMKEIVRALEGSLCLVKCVDDPSVCHRVKICVTRDLWRAVSDNIMKTLEAVTLKDMAENRDRKGAPNFMYEI